VESALDRGDEVTTVTRGISGPPASGARPLFVDRTDVEALRTALGGGSWEAVIDTWSGAPAVVSAAARLLSDRVGHYGYVSSRSVYRWPIPLALDETGPVFDGDPESLDEDDYAAAKRGGELAVLGLFPGRALLARAGLILGPYEIVGRLPWWLRRLERGGPTLAPGPEDRPLQYIDGRDLARWMVNAAAEGITGTFNTVSRPGHATMGTLLEAATAVTGSRAQLVWVPPDVITAARIEPWTELPIWVPPTGEYAGLHDGDVSAAYARGLSCRPVEETVADTWRWLQQEGDRLPSRDLGLDPAREKELLDRL